MALLETALACIGSRKTQRVEPTSGINAILYVLKRVVNGGNCPVSFHPGAQFITIFTVGCITGHGSASIIYCAHGRKKNTDATSTRQQVV